VEDRSQRIAPDSTNGLPNNPAALANQGTAVTVSGEDDLAAVQMTASVFCLDPIDANTPIEVDVYFGISGVLRLWTATDKRFEQSQTCS
jgi:hypothetical protein